MSVMPDIQTLGFTADGGLGEKAKIGLIVLQSDQTIEHEFARVLRRNGVALYHARIPNEMNVTCSTLQKMEADLPAAAALLPATFGLDSIGYCCTSGATLIGEARVDELLRKEHPNAKTTNPLTACKAALKALKLRKIALITPYAAEVTTELRDNLAAAGFEVTAVGTFNQSDDFKVARISPESILAAVKDIGQRTDCDGVFVSCTSLRVMEVIAEAEKAICKPVLSSNQVTAWHLARLAGVGDNIAGAGMLFHTQLRAEN
ncbi:Asp/Glu racemase [Rhodobacteraceae bacterium (ex Bugula neritina AB1)]|nr:Asp/Glu racemase [Rhodobacteraceae bacterium (ex Bugula neritina AB1)]